MEEKNSENNCFSVVRYSYIISVESWDYIKKLDEFTLKASDKCGEEAYFDVTPTYTHPETGHTFHPRLEIRGSHGELLEVVSRREVSDVNRMRVKLKRTFKAGEYYTIRISYLIPIEWWRRRKGEAEEGGGSLIWFEERKYWGIGPPVLIMNESRPFKKAVSVYPYVDVPPGYVAKGLVKIYRKVNGQQLLLRKDFNPQFGLRFMLDEDSLFYAKYEVKPKKSVFLIMLSAFGIILLLFALPLLLPVAPIYKVGTNLGLIPILLALIDAVDYWPFEKWIASLRILTALNVAYTVAFGLIYPLLRGYQLA